MTAPKTIADGRPKARRNHAQPHSGYFYFYRDGLAVNDPNYPAYRLANHVIGGHFYSRLYSTSP